MRPRLGLGVGAQAVRALLVKGDRVLWSGQAALRTDVPLAEAIVELVRQAPLPRWPRVRAAVALGPSRAQVKQLARLPPVGEPEVLAAIVREGAGRFFLRNGVPLVTTGVQPLDDGEGWAAALDEPAVEAVREGCRRAGLRLWGVLPAALAITGGLQNDRIRWADGGLCAEVVTDGGRLISVRRYPLKQEAAEVPGHAPSSTDRLETAPESPAWLDDEPPDVVEALETIEDGWRFADAYGAATLERRGPLVLSGASAGGLGSGRVPGRLRLAAALWILAGLAGLASPLASELAARRAESGLAIAADARWRTILAAENEFERITSALQELEALAGSRRPALLLLAELTRALPEETALVKLELAGETGSLVALTPRAAHVLSALQDAPGVVSPQIAAPIAPETVGERERERISIRFLRPDPGALIEAER